MLKSILTYLLIAVMVIGIMFPIYIMIRISFSEPKDVFQERPSYWIAQGTGRHFMNVLRSGEEFFAPLRKSLIVAFGVSFIGLLIATPAAYAISRFQYRVRYGFLILIFVARMIPEVSIALPVSISFIRLGLFDTIPGLILAHLIRVLPVICFIMTGVFADFPRDIVEQAYIDGCNRFEAFIKVVLPLTATGISVAGVFAFLFSWDEFIYASYLCLAHVTMPLKVYYYVSRGNIFYSATYAVIITLPVLILTLVLQKYLKPEYLAGAVKG